MALNASQRQRLSVVHKCAGRWTKKDAGEPAFFSLSTAVRMPVCHALIEPNLPGA